MKPSTTVLGRGARHAPDLSTSLLEQQFLVVGVLYQERNAGAADDRTKMAERTFKHREGLGAVDQDARQFAARRLGDFLAHRIRYGAVYNDIIDIEQSNGAARRVSQPLGDIVDPLGERRTKVPPNIRRRPDPSVVLAIQLAGE